MVKLKKFTIPEVATLLYEKSGLLGVSDISSDVRKLEASQSANAAKAIQLFCYRAACELSKLVTALKGCEAIVFTAGIRENATQVRKGICEWLDWLGVKLNDVANQKNLSVISHTNSKIVVLVIPTNEELMIAKHTLSLL